MPKAQRPAAQKKGKPPAANKPKKNAKSAGAGMAAAGQKLDKAKPHTPATPTLDAMGQDFSSVRVHSDSKGAEMNRGLGAQAFTHGNDIAFGPGQYQPGGGGQQVLGHELAHVVQQRQGRVKPTN